MEKVDVCIIAWLHLIWDPDTHFFDILKEFRGTNVRKYYIECNFMAFNLRMHLILSTKNVYFLGNEICEDTEACI